MPPDDLVGLDPDRVRGLVTAMRTAGDSWRAHHDDLTGLAAALHLTAELQPALDALTDAAGDCELAATDMTRRAELAEAWDRGDGMAANALAAELAGSTAAWEAAVPGGFDDGEVTTTITTLDDFLTRLAPAPARITGAVGDQWCVGGGDYISGGTLVGPDGLTYEVTVPRVHARGPDGPVTVNADWGTAADGADAWTLDGADPGWVTVGRERGVGNEADIELGSAILAGPSGAAVIHADGTRSGTLAEHASLELDEFGAPVDVDGRSGGSMALPDSVDETAGAVPVIVTSADGHRRIEHTTPTGTAAASAGVAELVVQLAESTDGYREAVNEGNVAYAVEYQEHADGRRRAIVTGYHVVYDDDGEPTVLANYLAFDAEGEPSPQPVRPRLHDGYEPPLPVNPYLED